MEETNALYAIESDISHSQSLEHERSDMRHRIRNVLDEAEADGAAQAASDAHEPFPGAQVHN